MRFDDKTKLIDKYPYFCDENGNVYVMGHDYGTYGYKIINLEGDGNKVVNDPTKEQKLYALLNYIWIDNLTNHNKTGIYNLMDEQVVDSFNSMFFLKSNEPNLTTRGIFARFGLNPSGELDQGALNGLVKDIVMECKGKTEISDIEYVFREKKPASFFALTRAEDGKVYVVKPDYKNYGFEIHEYDGKLVENPTQFQKENAFLNLVLADNVMNPSKTGIYSADRDCLEDQVDAVLCDLHNNKFDSNNLLKKFGLYFDGELMASAADKLVASLKPKEEENVM